MTLTLIVLAAPLIAFAAIGCVPPLRRSGRPAAFASIAAMAVSLGAAIVQAAPFFGGSGAAAARTNRLELALGGTRLRRACDFSRPVPPSTSPLLAQR